MSTDGDRPEKHDLHKHVELLGGDKLGRIIFDSLPRSVYNRLFDLGDKKVFDHMATGYAATHMTVTSIAGGAEIVRAMGTVDRAVLSSITAIIDDSFGKENIPREVVARLYGAILFIIANKETLFPEKVEPVIGPDGWAKGRKA